MYGNTLESDKNPILIVEDNRTQAEYLKQILEREGYSAEIVLNGLKAQEAIKQWQPSLILTDIIMPGMDGYELCKWVKRNEDKTDIPVILVTHLCDPVDVIKGLESGADNFIIKPFDPDSVISRIQRTLETPKGKNGSDDPVNLSSICGEHTITANRLQIMNILLSTYETAVKKNSELEIAHEESYFLNEQLKRVVSDLAHSNKNLNQEIIERQNISAALANANKKLQLMATISRHDLLNQLNSLQGYLELSIIDKDTCPETAWGYVSKAMMIAGNTINTVKFTKEYQEIGVNSPLWQNIRNMVENASNHSIPDHVHLHNNLPENIEVYADPLIEMVFSNLIDNAKKYGQKLSSISFSLEKAQSGYLIICEDDGIGVSDFEKDKIFTYSYGKNTGLGLFLTKEILAITGISICENGKSGRGARFEIMCPDEKIRRI